METDNIDLDSLRFFPTCNYFILKEPQIVLLIQFYSTFCYSAACNVPVLCNQMHNVYKKKRIGHNTQKLHQ